MSEMISFRNNINTIFEPRENGVFHYTSIKGLLGIIENQCLFATHIKFLNDALEYDTGYKLLRDGINKIEESAKVKNFDDSLFEFLKDDLPKRSNLLDTYKKINNNHAFKFFQRYIYSNVYTVSFCVKPDELNHWITYAKESGISIEFDFENFVFIEKNIRKQTNKLDGPLNKYKLDRVEIFQDSLPRLVTYFDDKKDKELTEIIKELISELTKELDKELRLEPDPFHIYSIKFEFLRRLFSFVPFIKTFPYQNEQEVRLAFREKHEHIRTPNEIFPIDNCVQYRLRNNVLTPYLEIGWKSVDNVPRTPIKSITIGPGNNQDLQFESIIQFIEDQDEMTIPTRKVSSYGILPTKEYKIQYMSKKGILINKSKISYIF